MRYLAAVNGVNIDKVNREVLNQTSALPPPENHRLQEGMDTVAVFGPLLIRAISYLEGVRFAARLLQHKHLGEVTRNSQGSAPEKWCVQSLL